MLNLSYIFSKFILKLHRPAIKYSKVHKTSKIEGGSRFYFSSMDKYSFCGYNCDIYHAQIGSFSSLGNSVIIGGGIHPMEWASTSPVFYSGRDSVKAKFSEYDRTAVKMTIVGHDVWIARSVIILPGVVIGNGAVIGAGSVVTNSIPPYAVAVGNPAKVIKYRFTESVCERLLESEWWKIDESLLRIHAKYIRTPELFLKSLNEQ